MNVIQQQTLLMSAFFVSFFLGAMEQEVPHTSTAVAVEQEQLPPNPLLKEFFVKSALQEDFDQAQFYKSHPDMFGVPSPIVQSLPTLIPDVCKNVLTYLGPDYTYTKTALGFVALPKKPDVYGLSDGGGEQMPLCSNLNNLKMVKMIISGREGNPSGKDVLAEVGDKNCNFDIQLHHSYSNVRFDDDYAGKESTYYWDSVLSIKSQFSNLVYDGVNRYGNAVMIVDFPSVNDCYGFAVLNVDNPRMESLVNGRNYSYFFFANEAEFVSDRFLGFCSAMGLHYASNRVGVCSFDDKKNVANICVYDFNAALSSKNNDSLITWQGALPEEFRKCIFLTASTLLGITMDGKLYSMVLKDDRSISVHRQVLKDLNKKDLLIKKIAVDFMDPRRVVFVATEQENLYLMDLKSEKKIFVKIQDRILQNSVERLWFADGKIGMKYISGKSGKNDGEILEHNLFIQQFDYIPF